MTKCEIQILITNNNKHEKQKQKPDQTQHMTETVAFDLRNELTKFSRV